MTEHDFHCFQEVAKRLNFTVAAGNLYISQPALSKQIARMEEELGFPLFLRTRQDVKLTPGGMVLLGEYSRVAGAYRDMMERARLASEGKTGKLRICIQEGQYLDEHILKLVQRFRRQYTGIELEVECLPYRQLLDQIQQERTDIGICLRFDAQDFAAMNSQEIKVMPSYVILSEQHPLAAPGALDELTALSGENLLVAGNEVVPRGAQFVLDQCTRIRVTPRNVLMVSSYATLYLRLTMGDGFVVMNQNVWFTNKGLRFHPLPRDLDVAQITCWSRDNHNPAVPLFLSEIKGVTSDGIY